MATEVLRPQDILIERIRTPPASVFHFPRRKNFNGTVAKPNGISKPAAAVQRKRSLVNNGQLNPNSTTLIPRRFSFDDLRSARSPITGQVTILRRGETLEVRETVTPRPAKKAETRIGSDPGRGSGSDDSGELVRRIRVLRFSVAGFASLAIVLKEADESRRR